MNERSRHTARARRDTMKNRRAWDTDSAAYQDKHGRYLKGKHALAWGVWRIPEGELSVLGPVRGKQILELGCGAAQWSIGLRQKRARPVALDISFNQLRHAEAKVPLVQADAVLLPFKDASFQIIFCDYGATSFADPYLLVPEVARVLEPGGLFAFTTTTPFLQMCWPDGEDQVTTTLHTSYFGMHRAEWTADDTVDYQLPYGDWIRLFRSNDLLVEDLIEIQPPSGSRTTFPGRPLSWARRWPAEMIWKVRRADHP